MCFFQEAVMSDDRDRTLLNVKSFLLTVEKINQLLNQRHFGFTDQDLQFLMPQTLQATEDFESRH